MSNIFEYKPELQYILQDVNSIDNVRDGRIQSMQSYIINSTAPVIQAASDIKQTLGEIKADIDAKLEKVTAPANIELDDILRERLSGISDSAKLINDGIITYEMYKKAKDTPILAPIEDAWDEYHCGMNGVLEAEILPYVEVADNVVDNVLQLINDAILYDEDPQARSDLKALKESELLRVERYIYLQDELEKAMQKSDRSAYITLKKQFDSLENKMKYTKNVNLVLADVLARLGNIAQDMRDGTLDEFHRIQSDALSEQLITLKNNLGISDLVMRTIIYSSFMGQYTDVLNLKRNYKNIASNAIRGNTFKTTITKSRLYRDVAVPSMIELAYADGTLQMNGAGNVLVSGIEHLTDTYQGSVLTTKNMLESDLGVTKTLINKVYEKYRSRTMYNLMGI